MNAVESAKATRTAIVQVRVTEAEKSDLQQQARQLGISVSDLARARLLARRPPRRRQEPVASYQPMNPRMFAHLSRIGNNLNQLTRAFNSTGDLKSANALEIVSEVWDVMMKDEVIKRHAQEAESKVQAAFTAQGRHP